MRTWTADDDLVFFGTAGDYLGGSALRRPYDTAVARAGLRKLRLHGVHHTFGTRMIAKADIRRARMTVALSALTSRGVNSQPALTPMA